MSAKGCSFDAIAELSGMSIATMQIFFHQFWAKFNENFREEWIVYPTTAVEAADTLEIYKRLGFPGAVGSVDCTHALWGRCPTQNQSAYSGKEETHRSLRSNCRPYSENFIRFDRAPRF